MTTPERERYQELLFQFATSYYAAGRWSAAARLSTISGNLFHHAIEYYLKGALAPSTSAEQMKKAGHNLKRVWRSVKAVGINLPAHDRTIADVHRFERIRYPEKIVRAGLTMSTSLGPGGPHLAQQPSTIPHYRLSVSEIDDLVIAILDAANVHPFWTSVTLGEQGGLWLRDGNAHAKRWTSDGIPSVNLPA
jgi:hypothetical protein